MVSVWLGKGELVTWCGGWGMGREHNFPGRVSAPPQGHHSQGTRPGGLALSRMTQA